MSDFLLANNGALIRFNSTQRYATVTRERYNKRDVGPGDYDVAIFSVIDVVMLDDGRKRTIRLEWPRTFTVISNAEAA